MSETKIPHCSRDVRDPRDRLPRVRAGQLLFQRLSGADRDSYSNANTNPDHDADHHDNSDSHDYGDSHPHDHDHADNHGNTDANGDTYWGSANTNYHCNGYSDSDTNPDDHRYPHADPDGDAYSDNDGHGDPDDHSNSHADVDPNSHTDAYDYRNRDADTHQDSYSNADGAANAAGHSVFKSADSSNLGGSLAANSSAFGRPRSPDTAAKRANQPAGSAMRKVVALALSLLLFVVTPRASAQTAPLLIANEIGVTLTLCPNGPPVSGVCPAGVISLTGKAVTLRSLLNTKVVNFTTAVSVDGTYSTYVTQAGDFPTDGIYQLQLIAVGGGQTLRSQIVRFQVGPALSGSP